MLLNNVFAVEEQALQIYTNLGIRTVGCAYVRLSAEVLSEYRGVFEVPAEWGGSGGNGGEWLVWEDKSR